LYSGDIQLGDTIDIKFTTRKFSTGAPYTLAGSPVVSAYVDNGTTEITAGITLSADFDSVVGLNNVRVVASGGNGFAAASNVALVITTGTVDSVSVVGEVVGAFSIANRPVNATKINGVSASSVTTINANLGTTQPVNFTGTAGSALVKSDAVDIAGAAVTSGAIPSAVAGAAGGLFIAGTNAPVTITGSGNALSIASTGGGGTAVVLTGNGSGGGLYAIGGGTGPGITASAGGGNNPGLYALGAGTEPAVDIHAFGTGPGLRVQTAAGDGISIAPTAGHGVNIAANGTSKHGVLSTGGTAGTSDGIKAVAGTGGVPIRGDITGNITGNLSGSVGSLTTNNDKTGYALTSAYDPAKTAAQAGDSMALTSGERTSTGTAVWATTTRLLTAGTNIVLAKGTGVTGFNDIAASAIIDDATPFHGASVAAIKAKTDLIPAAPASTTNITAASGVALTSAYDPAKTAAQAGDAMALTSGERNSVATAHLDLANGVETGLTVRQGHKLAAAALAGKISGAATSTVVIRNPGDTKDRITATVDASGNRAAITTDLT
jgi:hypothetical protein